MVGREIGDNVSQVIKDNGKKSLDKSIKVYVVTEDTAFLTKDESWETVRKSMHKNYVILRYHSIDKRSAFVRKNQQNIVEFSHLSNDVLQQYIYKDLYTNYPSSRYTQTALSAMFFEKIKQKDYANARNRSENISTSYSL